MIHKFKDYEPKLGANTWVAPSADVIGDVECGEDCSFWFGTVVRGDVHYIKIGDRVSVQDLSMIHVTHHKGAERANNGDGNPTIIGNDVTIGHRVMLHGCTIEDHCLIGMQSVILDGAIIQAQVMLGAGSLVSPGKVLESGYLYVGRPAVQKRKLTDEEITFLNYSAQNYVKLKDTYL